MKNFVAFISVFLITICLTAQNIENDETKKSKIQSNKIRIKNSEVIGVKTINQNELNPKSELKSNLLEDLMKLNFSPKSVYFRIIAEELEFVHNEMLT